MEFLWLFILSIPIFYIYGLVSFIRDISKPKNNQNPTLPAPENAVTPVVKGSTFTSAPAQGAKSNTNVDTLWSNWYSNNSINLLLYIGAFLIVASASIFVGFQWQVISGTLKAGLLTTVALLFFAFGIWFYNIPKIKNAGSTFIGIGALLIPICGSAWYNFVFKDLDAHAGPVWLVTSVVALSAYVFLAFNFKNKFYTYISNIASLSVVLSLMNTLGLSSSYYVLAGILTSFILLLISFSARNVPKEMEEFTRVPLEITANIMAPVTLVYGLILATIHASFFTFENAACLLIAALFYALSYAKQKEPWNVVAAQILFTFAVVSFLKWLNIENTAVFYGINAVSFTYIYTALFWKGEKKPDEEDISIIVGFTQIILVVIFSLYLPIEWFNKVLFAFAPVLAGFLVAYIKRKITYIGISTIFFALTLFLINNHIINFGNHPEYLSIAYIIMGAGNYVACFIYKKRQDALEAFGVSSIFYFLLAVAFSIGHAGFLSGVNVVIGITSVFAAIQLSIPQLIYVSNVFFYFALFAFLSYIKVESGLFPLFFAPLAWIYYFVSFRVDEKHKLFYRYSALAASSLTTLGDGFVGHVNSYFYKELERNALISSYSTTALFALDSYFQQKAAFVYAASTFGMLTFLWQINLLHVTESLAYTIPLGIYFMALAYHRKIKNDNEGREILDLIGLFFLFVPNFFLSFGSDGIKYSLALGAIGIILIILGISLMYKKYRYAGVAGIIAAVLPQTYSYILMLPRWLVVGIIGFVFISVAIFLLVKRTEVVKNEK